jgi:hypothetical protein
MVRRSWQLRDTAAANDCGGMGADEALPTIRRAWGVRARAGQAVATLKET